MRLGIVIPALNEEDAIGSTIERCLAARSKITSQTQVDAVEIIVVSDGSTDRTVEIAKSFNEVTLIEFKENQGYGAAIKAGWEKSSADLLSFLDADGTCDPLYFVDMVKCITEDDQDIVLGSRMGPNSKMPKIRRLGNMFFAGLLKFLARKPLTDSASGMRVVRRSVLKLIYPLPDGLHFTPAMSARALLDQGINIAEINMDYSERIGRSKLSVVKDGWRFLNSIVATALYLKPSSLTLPLIALLCVPGLILFFDSVGHYIAYKKIPEWMIYRSLFMFFLANLVLFIFNFTVVSEHIIAVSLFKFKKYREFGNQFFSLKFFKAYFWLSLIGVSAAVYLLAPGIKTYVLRGEILPEALHWSQVIVASLFLVISLQIFYTIMVLKTIYSLNLKQAFLIPEEERSSAQKPQRTKIEGARISEHNVATSEP